MLPVSLSFDLSKGGPIRVCTGSSRLVSRVKCTDLHVPLSTVYCQACLFTYYSLVVFFAVRGIQPLSPIPFPYPPPAPCPVHPVLSPALCLPLCLVPQSPQTSFQLHLQFLLDHSPGGCLWKRWGPSGAGMGSTVLLRVDLKPVLQYLPRFFSAPPKYSQPRGA